MGMMVDVSHISDKACWMQWKRARLRCWHRIPRQRSIAPIVRNMPDEVIKAIAKKGGVVCINFHAGYLDKAAYDVYIANRPARDKEIKEVLKRDRRTRRAGRWCEAYSESTLRRCRKWITRFC